jgi:hypothetical protein
MMKVSGICLSVLWLLLSPGDRQQETTRIGPGYKAGSSRSDLPEKLKLPVPRPRVAERESAMNLKAVRNKATGRLPLLSLAETWRRLPAAPAQETPLPSWARMLAGLFPQTTARLLELDALHRRGDRLDARLRCLARWAAACATGCTYSQARAAADFRRAGGQDADWLQATRHPEHLPLVDRLVMAFARQLMLQPAAVTDEAFQQLLEVLGEERTVALVALLAHAAFQDRLFLALGVSAETEEPLPPIEFSFLWPPPAKTPPPAAAPVPAAWLASAPISEEWRRLQAALEQQQRRPGRIRVPSRAEVLRRLGPDHPARWQSDILWSRVCYGYQPELTDAWFASVAAFRQEAQIDAVFGNCLFWIATQARQCFY